MLFYRFRHQSTSTDRFHAPNAALVTCEFHCQLCKSNTESKLYSDRRLDPTQPIRYPQGCMFVNMQEGGSEINVEK